jgi:GTP-binding protein HflX
MFDNEEKIEKAILFAVSLDGSDVNDSLDELVELLDTAGGEAVGRITQNKEFYDKATYIGKGKVEELRELLLVTGATLAVCDDELSPIQQRNLENALDVTVLDRTAVILDIFARHATTSEGKIQVELAQLKYRATRLVGSRSELSRLGGGIGTRGPGEKKLETDRRLIRTRIGQLKRELEDVKQHRDVMRKQRMTTGIPIVSIVGYTNAGKSTLLNHLTNAGVLQEDKLFATLDPTSRNLKLASGQEIILTDTVGFIRKLPHHLVDAFRSTLEESKYADIILHVVDASNPQAEVHIRTVYETLDRLGCGDKKIITLFNKVDRLDIRPVIEDLRAERCLMISAKTGENMEECLSAIEDMINAGRQYIETEISYSDAGVINRIRKYGTLLSEEYTDTGILIKAYVPRDFM